MLFVNGKPIFFPDELQIIKGWEKFARRLADTGYLVFITGSNATYLQNNPVKRVFNEYFTLGGLPEVIKTSQPFKRKWLSSLVRQDIFR